MNSDFLADLSFDARCGDTTSRETEKPELRIIDNLVTIYPLRYKLIRTVAYDDFTDDCLPLINNHASYTEITNDKLPKIEGYKYVAAPLRSGWLYVYDRTLGDISEYEVVASPGNTVLQLCCCNTFEKKIRMPIRGTYKQDGLDVPKDSDIYMEFSETQWDGDIIRPFIEENYETYFQKISVPSWIASSVQPGVFDVKEIEKSFYPDEVVVPIRPIEFASIYSDVCEILPGENPKEEVFVCIHDRYGVANDICDDIKKLNFLHESVLQSIRTGTDQASFYRALLKDSNAQPKDYVDSSVNMMPLMEYENMHHLAVNTYRNLFFHDLSSNIPQEVIQEIQESTNESRKDIEEKLNEQKEELEELKEKVHKGALEKVLAVRERKSIRDSINGSRKMLLKIQKSDYYQFTYASVGLDWAQYLQQTKSIYLYHHGMLADAPHAKDGYIDLKVDAEVEGIAGFFQNILTESSEHTRIMQYELLEIEKYVNSTDEVVLGLIGMIDIYAKFINGEKQFTVFSKYLNSAKFRDFAIETQFSTLDQILSDVDEISHIDGIEGKIKSKSLLASHIKRNLQRGKPIANFKIKLKGSYAGKKLRDVLDSPLMQGLGLALAGFNVLTAIKAYDTKSPFKSAISLSATSFSLMQITASYAITKKMFSSKTTLKLLTRLTGQTSVYISGGFGLILGVCDTKELFQKRDTDAALATLGSSAFAVGAIIFSVKAGVIAGGTTSILSIKVTWPIWACGILSLGLMFLAIYLTDNPYEAFYKNFIFNSSKIQKHLRKVLDTQSPQVLMDSAYQKRELLVGSGFSEWESQGVALAEIESLYPQIMIGVNCKKKMRDLTDGNYIQSAEIVYEISFSLHFNQWVPNMEIDYGLFSFDNDKGKMRSIYPIDKSLSQFRIDTLNGSPIITYGIGNIPVSKLGNFAYFYVRIVIDPIRKIYWPSEQNNKSRYLFVKKALYSGVVEVPFMLRVTSSIFMDYMDYTNKKTNTIKALEEFNL